MSESQRRNKETLNHWLNHNRNFYFALSEKIGSIGSFVILKLIAVSRNENQIASQIHPPNLQSVCFEFLNENDLRERFCFKIWKCEIIWKSGQKSENLVPPSTSYMLRIVYQWSCSLEGWDVADGLAAACVNQNGDGAAILVRRRYSNPAVPRETWLRDPIQRTGWTLDSVQQVWCNPDDSKMKPELEYVVIWIYLWVKSLT